MEVDDADDEEVQSPPPSRTSMPPCHHTTISSSSISMNTLLLLLPFPYTLTHRAWSTWTLISDFLKSRELRFYSQKLIIVE